MHKTSGIMMLTGAIGAFLLVNLGVFAETSSRPDTSRGPSFKHVLSIDVVAKFITTDYMGNIYVVKQSEIVKYSSEGMQISSFSDRNAGTITSVDASNPLRVQVFYQDFGQIIYLDDVLSVIGSKISLLDQGLDQATLSCSSWDDGIWLYDPQDFQLKRMGSDLSLSQQSGNINQLLDVEINPICVLEKNNYVYLNDPAIGILVFDQFGTYFKTLPVRGIVHFQVGAEQLFYLLDGHLMSYDLKTFQYADLPISSDGETILDLRFEKESKLLVVLKEKSLELFVFED